MRTTLLVRLAVLAVGASLCGCASWQATPLPIPNATRVPPPGTGTYQLPKDYFNNSTSALPQAATSLHASQSPLGTQAMPVATSAAAGSRLTDMAAANNSPPASVGQFTDAPTSTVVTASATEPVQAAASGRLTDAGSTEPPSLQWQQYGGQ